MNHSQLEIEFAQEVSRKAGYIYTIIKNKYKGITESDAEEITSNVSINLWNKRASFFEGENSLDDVKLKKWVAKFTHNHCIWFFSKKFHKDKNIDFNSDKLDVVTSIIGEEDSGFSDYCEEESNKNLYHKYLSILNSEEKSIFALLWKGFSKKEIGDIYDLTREAIRQKVDAIRIKINKKFNSNSSDIAGEDRLSEKKKFSLLKEIIGADSDSPTHVA